ncbi:hypothetical protein SUDANB126_07389 [Streptomyces sp. enrichment culture]
MTPAAPSPDTHPCRDASGHRLPLPARHRLGRRQDLLGPDQRRHRTRRPGRPARPVLQHAHHRDPRPLEQTGPGRRVQPGAWRMPEEQRSRTPGRPTSRVVRSTAVAAHKEASASCKAKTLWPSTAATSTTTRPDSDTCTSSVARDAKTRDPRPGPSHPPVGVWSQETNGARRVARGHGQRNRTRPVSRNKPAPRPTERCTPRVPARFDTTGGVPRPAAFGSPCEPAGGRMTGVTSTPIVVHRPSRTNRPERHQTPTQTRQETRHRLQRPPPGRAPRSRRHSRPRRHPGRPAAGATARQPRPRGHLSTYPGMVRCSFGTLCPVPRKSRDQITEGPGP